MWTLTIFYYNILKIHLIVMQIQITTTECMITETTIALILFILWWSIFCFQSIHSTQIVWLPLLSTPISGRWWLRKVFEICKEWLRRAIKFDKHLSISVICLPSEVSLKSQFAWQKHLSRKLNTVELSAWTLYRHNTQEEWKKLLDSMCVIWVCLVLQKYSLFITHIRDKRVRGKSKAHASS